MAISKIIFFKDNPLYLGNFFNILFTYAISAHGLQIGRHRTHLKKFAIVFLLMMQTTRIKAAKIPTTALITRPFKSPLLIETDMGLLMSLKVGFLFPRPSLEVFFLCRCNAIDAWKKEVNAALAFVAILLINDRCVVDEDHSVILSADFILSLLCSAVDFRWEVVGLGVNFIVTRSL